MSSFKEQIGRRQRKQSKWRQAVKRLYNRWHRRLAKQNPEDAPRQRWYSGYD